MAEKKMTEAAVLALVEKEKITASRGAELLGIPLQDFFALMHAHGLTLCDDTPQDIRQDLEDVRKVLKKNAQKLAGRCLRCLSSHQLSAYQSTLFAGSNVRERMHSSGSLR